MRAVKEIDGGAVLSLVQRNRELIGEAAERHPKIVTDEQERLERRAVTAFQRLNEFGSRRLRMRVKPLLELIEHEDHFLGAERTLLQPLAQFGQRQVARQRWISIGNRAAKRRCQTRLGVMGVAFDADNSNLVTKLRRHAGFYQRRFAAARGTINDAHIQAAVWRRG